MPALTHGAWQQAEVGTGLEGLLPFTGPAKALCPRAAGVSANLCIACPLSPSVTADRPLHLFITVIKWRDRNVVECFFFSCAKKHGCKGLLTCEGLRFNSGFFCFAHDDKL